MKTTKTKKSKTFLNRLKNMFLIVASIIMILVVVNELVASTTYEADETVLGTSTSIMLTKESDKKIAEIKDREEFQEMMENTATKIYLEEKKKSLQEEIESLESELSEVREASL